MEKVDKQNIVTNIFEIYTLSGKWIISRPYIWIHGHADNIQTGLQIGIQKKYNEKIQTDRHKNDGQKSESKVHKHAVNRKVRQWDSKRTDNKDRLVGRQTDWETDKRTK